MNVFVAASILKLTGPPDWGVLSTSSLRSRVKWLRSDGLVSPSREPSDQ